MQVAALNVQANQTTMGFALTPRSDRDSRISPRTGVGPQMQYAQTRPQPPPQNGHLPAEHFAEHHEPSLPSLQRSQPPMEFQIQQRKDRASREMERQNQTDMAQDPIIQQKRRLSPTNAQSTHSTDAGGLAVPRLKLVHINQEADASVPSEEPASVDGAAAAVAAQLRQDRSVIDMIVKRVALLDENVDASPRHAFPKPERLEPVYSDYDFKEREAEIHASSSVSVNLKQQTRTQRSAPAPISDNMKADPPVADPVEPADCLETRVGLLLRRRPNQAVEVVSIAQGSAAAQLAVFQAGDRLLAINGQPTKQIPMQDIRGLFALAGVRTKLDVARGDAIPFVVIFPEAPGSHANSSLDTPIHQEVESEAFRRALERDCSPMGITLVLKENIDVLKQLSDGVYRDVLFRELAVHSCCTPKARLQSALHLAAQRTLFVCTSARAQTAGTLARMHAFASL